MAKKQSNEEDVNAFFNIDEVTEMAEPEVSIEEKKQLEKIIPQIPKINQQVPNQQKPQPEQEIKASPEEPFIPSNLPSRKLDQIIEDWAEKRKQHDIDMAYKKLTNMLFQTENVQPALAQSQPTVKEVLVKDPSDSIKMLTSNIQFINSQIVNSKSDLAPLIIIKNNLKRQLAELQGEPFVEEQIPENSKQELGKNKDKGEISTKKALAVFLAAVGVSAMVYLSWFLHLI